MNDLRDDVSIQNKILECSCCGKKHHSVKRDAFDGMCSKCRDGSLYDSIDAFEEASDKAQKRNKELLDSEIIKNQPLFD